MSKSNHFLLFMICSSLQPFAFYMHKSTDKELVRRIFPPFSRNWEEKRRIQEEKKAKCSIHKQEFKSNFLIMRKSMWSTHQIICCSYLLEFTCMYPRILTSLVNVIRDPYAITLKYQHLHISFISEMFTSLQQNEKFVQAEWNRQ